MAFKKSDALKVFRTVTPGDYFLAKVVSVEEGEKVDSLLVESYDNDGKMTPKLVKGKLEDRPTPVNFLFYDLNGVRDYKRRKKRADGGTVGDVAAHKYIMGVCTGVNEAGFGQFEVSFTDDPADMAKMKEEKGGKYWVLHEAPRPERANNPDPKSGNTNSKGSAKSDDEDIPF